uniref:RAB6-interacting golgin n=1 Tax=Caenorhabditis tropicalis TaxID=1561998 RepID=A0A1I7T421_9PELO
MENSDAGPGTPTPEEINNFLNPVKVFQVCSEKIKSLESELERAKIDAKRQADENKAKILKLSKKAINQEYTIKSFKLSLSAKEKELKATEKKYEFAKKVMECVKNTSDLREKFLLDVVKNAEILSKTERDSLNSVKRSKVNLITEVIKLRKENNKLKSKISMSSGLKSITSKKQKEDQKTKLFDGKDLSNWSGSQIKPIIDETNVNF